MRVVFYCLDAMRVIFYSLDAMRVVFYSLNFIDVIVQLAYYYLLVRSSSVFIAITVLVSNPYC